MDGSALPPQGGTLRQHIERDAAGPRHLQCREHEQKVWNIVLQLARGLAHMHRPHQVRDADNMPLYDASNKPIFEPIIHCDLKPDNILMCDKGTTFKIGDLGLATPVSQWQEGMEGDPCYLSKDLIQYKPSTAADIFSFGIMIYQIVSGEQLLGQGERWEQLRTADPTDPSGSKPFVPPPSTASPRMQQLISRTMSPSPAARLTASSILKLTQEATVEAAQQGAIGRVRRI